MISYDTSYEISYETHMRFGERWCRTAMPSRVPNPNHRRSSYRSPAYYQHSRELVTTLKIQNRHFLSHMRSHMRNLSFSAVKSQGKIDAEIFFHFPPNLIDLILTVTKYEYLTPLQLEDIHKNAIKFFPKKKIISE